MIEFIQFEILGLISSMNLRKTKRELVILTQIFCQTTPIIGATIKVEISYRNSEDTK